MIGSEKLIHAGREKRGEAACGGSGKRKETGQEIRPSQRLQRAQCSQQGQQTHLEPGNRGGGEEVWEDSINLKIRRLKYP